VLGVLRHERRRQRWSEGELVGAQPITMRVCGRLRTLSPRRRWPSRRRRAGSCGLGRRKTFNRHPRLDARTERRISVSRGARPSNARDRARSPPHHERSATPRRPRSRHQSGGVECCHCDEHPARRSLPVGDELEARHLRGPHPRFAISRNEIVGTSGTHAFMSLASATAAGEHHRCITSASEQAGTVRRRKQRGPPMGWRC
jgi:hypothetical protein